MKLSFFLSFLLVSCASQQPIEVTAMQDFIFPVKLATLKKYTEVFIEEDFKKSQESRKRHEVLSLKEHSYRFHGKLHPPLDEVKSHFLLRREFASAEDAMRVAYETVEEDSNHFLLLYQNHFYEGRALTGGKSRLYVSKAETFYKVKELVSMENSLEDKPLSFESNTIDLDKTLKDAKRALARELEVKSIVEDEEKEYFGKSL